jgi:hypothetical protein
MSARRKTPTADDNKRTAIFDAGKHARGHDDPEVDPTVVDGPLGGAAMAEQPGPNHTGPTVVDGPLGGAAMSAAAAQAMASKAAPTVLGKPVPQAPSAKAAPTVLAKPVPQPVANKDASAPVRAISMKEAGQPIQAISMKTPGGPGGLGEPNPPTPILPRPKLRAVSEVTPAQAPQNLGHVAPPYDPEEARARKVREYVIWGCVAVMLASVIALVVWFAAR